MEYSALILILEAVVVYAMVLWSHSLRHLAGMAPFYAMLGGITAVMSWVTDAGVKVEVGGITFMVGSTVFYTSLLLGVFVVYVFDGPRATRVAILTVAGISIMSPLVALSMHLQMSISGGGNLSSVPIPSLRINTASVLTTIADLIFLAVAWEFLGKPKLNMQLWLRALLTLLGVMWLDVLLFTTGAFFGRPEYLQIMGGTFTTRLLISLLACPFLYLYLQWQSRYRGMEIENRPVLAILRQIAEVRAELSLAQLEIERRKVAERDKQAAIEQLQTSLARVRKLEDLLPVCSGCRKIRKDATSAAQPDVWLPLEDYITQETDTRFSHGLCPDCVRQLYPDMAESIITQSEQARQTRFSGQDRNATSPEQ